MTPSHERQGTEPTPSDMTDPVRRGWLLASAGLVACAAGAAGGWWLLTHGALAGEDAKLLQASFPDLEGRQTPISSWKGKTRLINFWATWCTPCREEMPEFVQAQQRYGARGLQIVGIAIDRKEPVQRFVRQLGINYPILMGDPAWLDAIKTMGNPQGVLPFSMILAPDDSVMLRRVGKLKLSEISAIFN